MATGMGLVLGCFAALGLIATMEWKQQQAWAGTTTAPMPGPSIPAAPAKESGGLLEKMVGPTHGRVNGIVTLTGDDCIQTPEVFAPPVAFRIEVETDFSNIRIGYIAKQMIFNWEDDPHQFRIDGRPADGRHKPGAGYVSINHWAIIEIVTLKNQLIIRVDGKERYRTSADFSKSSGPLSIFTYGGSTVRVKSVEVEKRSEG